MENDNSDWINTEDALPEFGRTVIADDDALAWFDRQVGWLTFDHKNQWHQPRQAPKRWRYLQITATDLPPEQ